MFDMILDIFNQNVDEEAENKIHNYYKRICYMNKTYEKLDEILSYSCRFCRKREASLERKFKEGKYVFDSTNYCRCTSCGTCFERDWHAYLIRHTKNKCISKGKKYCLLCKWDKFDNELKGFSSLHEELKSSYRAFKREYLIWENNKKSEINRKKFKDLMLRAEDDLNEYIEKWEEENEETNVERPIYYAELKQCKNIKEIYEYMKDFGWENE